MGFCFIFHWYLTYLIVNGVFGDEVKSVSVMEGESITLHTGVVKQRDDLIVWYYGSENTVVAKINGEANSTKLSQDERLRGRLELSKQTGDLNISDVRTTDTGPYKLRISSNNKVSYKNFNIIVYTRLPVPVIVRDSSEDPSSSKCVVLCSVMNVSHDVSVSWYKGKSLLSSISVSDLNIRLSLPLEVEYQDTNTYRCVVNNPITNLTQHLHITQLCHTSSESPDQRLIVITAVAVSVFSVIIIIILIFMYRRAKAMSGKSSESQNHLTEENRSISSSRTSEDEESSKCLNEKQQHWIEAGSV